MRSTLVLLFFATALNANAAETPSMQAQNLLDSLKTQAKKEKWTFKFGMTPVMNRTLDQVTGLKRPADWRTKARFMNTKRFGATPLPAHYDWRDQVQGGLPPIKDQGQCGSCWAFGTVGVMESVVKIRDGVNKKFSEQYLISCDQNSLGCGGGYYAHYLHQDPGAVLDQDFPYQASNTDCPSSLPHDDKIMDWAYVGGSDQATPTTEQIKEAIYQYGPVAVTVYASGAMMSYQGGIFNSCDGGQTNHIVDLVGWDDTKGIWYMRNSWGDSWGENGYMEIPYGCSSVGETATYVDYKATNCSPKPVANAGTPQTIHSGESVLLGAMPVVGQTYAWSPTDGLDRPTDAMPLARPSQTTTYTLTTKSQCGNGSQQVTITVVP